MKIYKIFVLFLFITGLNAANNRITIDGNDYFIFGVNMGWIDGGYRYDFGYNEVYGWGPSYDSANVENYLEDLKNMGVKVIRLWIFEAYEGLMFNSQGYVTNVHPTLYNNMDDFVTRCENKNLYIYFCMISYLQHGADADAWKYLNIITNTTARSYYISNAVVPFVTRYKDSSAFFAVDVMNEPEFVVAGSTGNWTANGTTWAVMRSFIADCVSTIHNIDPNILVSCGSGWHNEENVVAGYYSGLGLDFYDYHKYDDAGNLVPYSSFGINKPCIIGECGQSTSSWDDSIQDSAAKNFMNNAWNNGYAGVLFWQYSYPGDTTEWNFVNSDASWRPVCYSVQEFALYHCEAININGVCTNEIPERLPKHYKFYFGQNPVKLNDGVKIYIKCDEERPVKIIVYTLGGKKIETLLNGEILSTGITYQIEWKSDNILPGLYVIYFKFGNYLPEFKTIGVIE